MYELGNVVYEPELRSLTKDKIKEIYFKQYLAFPIRKCIIYNCTYPVTWWQRRKMGAKLIQTYQGTHSRNKVSTYAWYF